MVDVRTLEPEGAEGVVVREPSPSGEGSHRADHPWGPMWRIEVASPRHFRSRIVGTPHPHIGLRQIVVQRGLLGAAGDCLLEKWYAFSESALLE